jgi:hypothetical protein
MRPAGKWTLRPGKVQHSIALSDAWIAEDNVKEKVLAKWPQIEPALKETIGESSTWSGGMESERNRHSSVIWTNSLLGVRIVRVDCYRTGKAKLNFGGDEIEAPFELRDGVEWRMELAK